MGKGDAIITSFRKGRLVPSSPRPGQTARRSTCPRSETQASPRPHASQGQPPASQTHLVGRTRRGEEVRGRKDHRAVCSFHFFLPPECGAFPRKGGKSSWRRLTFLNACVDLLARVRLGLRLRPRLSRDQRGKWGRGRWNRKGGRKGECDVTGGGRPPLRASSGLSPSSMPERGRLRGTPPAVRARASVMCVQSERVCDVGAQRRNIRHAPKTKPAPWFFARHIFGALAHRHNGACRARVELHPQEWRRW